jgi:hypothetical protein
VLRPEHIVLLKDKEADGLLTAPAIVQDVIHVGSHVLVTLRSGEISLTCRLSGNVPSHVTAGAYIFAGFRAADLHLIAS